MSNINVVVFTGNLTREPDCHYNGQKCERANFSVAVNKTWFKEGEKKQKTHYIDCVAWGPQANFVAQYTKKGSSVAVNGELDHQRWQSQDGQNKSKLAINVKSIQLLDKPPDDAIGHHEHYQQPKYNQQQQYVDPNDPIPF